MTIRYITEIGVSRAGRTRMTSRHKQKCAASGKSGGLNSEAPFTCSARKRQWVRLERGTN